MIKDELFDESDSTFSEPKNRKQDGTPTSVKESKTSNLRNAGAEESFGFEVVEWVIVYWKRISWIIAISVGTFGWVYRTEYGISVNKENISNISSDLENNLGKLEKQLANSKSEIRRFLNLESQNKQVFDRISEDLKELDDEIGNLEDALMELREKTANLQGRHGKIKED